MTLLTVGDDAWQEPEVVADVELRPARVALAAVAQRARRHRAVPLPAGHRAADRVDDGREDRRERGEEVVGAGRPGGGRGG